VDHRTGNAGCQRFQYTLNSLGNLLTFNPDGTGPSAQAFTYDNDSNDKLLTATRNGTTVTTHYDARRRAVARTVAPSVGSPVTTFFVWNEWSLIEERTASGNLVQSYVHGPVIDEILAKTDSAGTVYYHQDGLGSTTALSNASGTPVESYTYDAYGAARVWDGAGVGLASSALGNRFLFTGREWVAEAGIYDYRNRAYSAELGRFLQVDPVRFNGGDISLYRYVMGMPGDFKDSLGLRRVRAIVDCVCYKRAGPRCEKEEQYPGAGHVDREFEVPDSGDWNFILSLQIQIAASESCGPCNCFYVKATTCTIRTLILQ